MKKLTLLIAIVFLFSSGNVLSDQKKQGFMEKWFTPAGKSKSIEKNNQIIISGKKELNQEASSDCIKSNDNDKGFMKKWFTPAGKTTSEVEKNKCVKSKREVKTSNSNPTMSSTPNNDISFYAGTFDVIDKEGDDKTNLYGIEHKNPNLFRNTLLGKFSPVTGAFMTGNSSVYLYTGIEGQYGIGPLKILPSFTPGFYEKGGGKDLGSALEFKSEIKIGLDIFENSKIGYSYSHISNNDWGERNPGTDNQQVTFSKNF
jgi:lipid A 3-O-deacylase